MQGGKFSGLFIYLDLISCHSLILSSRPLTHFFLKIFTFLSCLQCDSAWYCDKECQIKAWKDHKVACKEMQRGQGTA